MNSESPHDERQWLYLDWIDGRDIDELCAEYNLSESEVWAVIEEKLGIGNNKEN